MKRGVTKKKKKMKNKSKEEVSTYEFCKLCKLNHNQGRRHNFFPRHTSSLSSLFSRFNQKLSSVKFSLTNPSFAPSSRDSLWCVFCDCDIDESNCEFSRSNAIKHLASDDHLINLKHFLWKYGGAMNKVDSFRITEAELAKWKKKCEALKKDAPSSSEMYNEFSHVLSNEMRITRYIIQIFQDRAKLVHFHMIVLHICPVPHNKAWELLVLHVKVGNYLSLQALVMILSEQGNKAPAESQLLMTIRVSLEYPVEVWKEIFILGHCLLGLKDLKHMMLIQERLE